MLAVRGDELMREATRPIVGSCRWTTQRDTASWLRVSGQSDLSKKRWNHIFHSHNYALLMKTNPVVYMSYKI